MISEAFQLRQAYTFRAVFLSFRHKSRITRQQFLFLSYLIGRGFNKDFHTSQVVTKGLSWDLAKCYLMYLKRVGHVSKNGKLWTVTEEGKKYYKDFLEEYRERLSGPFRWR